MNICFILDNSLVNSQVTHTGLTFLECAKNYIEKLVSSREMMEIKHDTYHLFKTSSLTPLSTYEHDQLHFFCQLKMVQPEILTVLTPVVREAFVACSRFRIAARCENVMGYTDPFSCQSSLVILLTGKSDQVQLQTLKESLRMGKLLNRYDSQFHIVSMGMSGRTERPINIENLRKQCQKHPNVELMREIAESMGGDLRLVMRYDQGFQIIDQLVNQFRTKFLIHMRVAEIEPSRFFRDSGVSTRDPVIQNCRLFTANTYQRSQVKKNSKVPLPEPLPGIMHGVPSINSQKLNAQSPETAFEVIDTYHFPELLVDFTKVLDCPLNKHLPIERLELDVNSQGAAVLGNIFQKLRGDKNFFPVFMADEEQKTVLIGLIRIQKLQTQFGNATTINNQIAPPPTTRESPCVLHLFLYLANFPELSIILDNLLAPLPPPELITNKRINNNNNPLAVREQQIEQQLAEYLRKIPVYYDVFVARLFVASRSYSREVPIRTNPRAFLNDKLEKYQEQDRRMAQQKYRENARLHSQYISECCYVFSQKYEEVARSLAKYKDRDIINRTLNNSMIAAFQLKKELRLADDDGLLSLQDRCVPVAKAQSYSFKNQVNQNSRFLDYPSRKRRPQASGSLVSASVKVQQPRLLAGNDDVAKASISPATPPTPIIFQSEKSGNDEARNNVKVEMQIERQGKKEVTASAKMDISQTVSISEAPSLKEESRGRSAGVPLLTEQEKVLAQVGRIFKAKKVKKLVVNPINLVVGEIGASSLHLSAFNQ